MGVAESKPEVKKEVEELLLLFEVSQLLDRSMDLQEELGPVLEVMTRYLSLKRAALMLLNRETSEIIIDEAANLTTSQQQRGRYKLGEGITGRVVETGEPEAVLRVSDDPRVLNRTGIKDAGRDEDVSMFCVPVKLDNEVIGALSILRNYSAEVTADDILRLLSVIASMIARAVRLRQVAEEERRWLLAENARLQNELRSRFRPKNIIGNSKAIQGVYDMIAQVSGSEATVLLRGESGVGKELVAHAIHYNSPRAAQPFVKVNCAALPESMLESELFGHEKGAFTGAIARRKGRFELANGGTIFLDEIGDFSPAAQVKLLRILQEKEFERVGGTEVLKVDVRVIAATNKDLEESIRDGSFREDLYYRLNVFPIHIPPLRERVGDITLLADYFIDKYSKSNHKAVRRISTAALDMLTRYHWPGNVRELENCMERAVLLTRDDVIRSHHLPPSLQTAEASGTVHHGTLKATLEALEYELLVDALKTSRGNMAEAARHLGITERMMGCRVRKYGINRKRFKK